MPSATKSDFYNRNNDEKIKLEGHSLLRYVSMTVKLSDSWKSQYIIDNKTKITQVKLFTIEIKLFANHLKFILHFSKISLMTKTQNSLLLIKKSIQITFGTNILLKSYMQFVVVQDYMN